MMLTLPILLSSLAALTIASPIQPREDVVVDVSSLGTKSTPAQVSAANKLQAAQASTSPTPLVTTSNDFLDSGCRDIILIFAKGSTETGNLGTLGSPTGDGLKAKYGAENVAVQGVDYPGFLITNLLPDNADPVGVAKGRDLFQKAASQCPDSIIVAGGYSQGAALMHAAIKSLSQTVKDHITAVVTFGDTRKKQDNSQIPNFPKDKVNIICNDGDLVCEGTLIITSAHLAYGPRVPEAVAFLESKIDAAR